MKGHAALLPLAFFFTLAAAETSASTPASTSLGTRTPDPAPQTQSLKFTPAADSTTSSAKPSHLFTVNDEKGLLLTCIAPEIDTNADTDVFKSCTLAPGRTLDDVMHTFVGALHLVQNEQMKERAEWYKSLEGQSAQKSAQK